MHTSRPARVKTHDSHTWDTLPISNKPDGTEDPDHFLDLAGPQSAVYDSDDAFTSAMLSMRLHCDQVSK